MKLTLLNRQKIAVAQPLLHKAISLILKEENVRTQEVEVHLVSKQEICQLHQEHFADPTPTDCISFPIDGRATTNNQILGVVFACPEVASEWVTENGGDLTQEICLYVIHGVLHLLGYDDIAEEDRLIMRQKEAHYLELTFAPVC